MSMGLHLRGGCAGLQNSQLSMHRWNSQIDQHAPSKHDITPTSSRDANSVCLWSPSLFQLRRAHLVYPEQELIQAKARSTVRPRLLRSPGEPLAHV